MMDRKEEGRRSRIGRRKEMILLCVDEDVQQPGEQDTNPRSVMVEP